MLGEAGAPISAGADHIKGAYGVPETTDAQALSSQPAPAGSARELLSRLRAHRNRARETVSALIASPDAPILELAGGWRGVFDATAPNLLFLVVYLVEADLIWATMSALAMSIVLALARRIARQPAGPAVIGMILVALSGLLALMGGDGGDVFLPDLIQTAVVSTVLFISLAVRRPLLGVILGPLVSGPHWRTRRTLRRGYAWATALWAAANAIRSLAKLPFYFADDVVALGITDLLTGVPLVIVTTYLQVRILRRAYSAAGATVGPDVRARIGQL